VAAQSGTEPIRSTWWKLECLGHPVLLESAVHATLEADLLFVSIIAEEAVPSELVAWTTQWAQRRQRREGALLALVGVNAGRGNSPLPVLDHLSQAANRLGLLYESQVRPLPEAGKSGLQPPNRFSPPPRPFDRHDGFRAENPHENWGIAE